MAAGAGGAAAAAAGGAGIPQIWGAEHPPPTEVYFLTPIANVLDILERGILSKKRATALNPVDIADQAVQDLRDGKAVTNPDRDAAGKKVLTIHRCANLYLRAHNAMMYVRRNLRDTLCVLRIDAQILTRQEVVATNMNAAKHAATFSQARNFSFSPASVPLHRAPQGYIPDDRVEERKAVRQAEVLIPYKVHPSFIKGAYVANAVAQAALTGALPQPSPIPIDLHPSLFFVGGNVLHPPPHPSPLANADHPALSFGLPTSSESEGDEDAHIEVDMGAAAAAAAAAAPDGAAQQDDAPDAPATPPKAEP